MHSLEKQYKVALDNGLLPILSTQETGKSTALATIPELVLDKSMYDPSRITRSVQYMLENNVVRIWKDEVISKSNLLGLGEGQKGLAE